VGRKIKVAVYGAGNFANKQHLPNLTRIPDVDVVAVSDINETAAKETAKAFDIPSVYTDAHEMLASEQIDALWSIVPAFARTDVESTAASQGVHILSEKPQALDMATAHQIDAAIRDAGVLSTVCFRERYRPIFQKARRLLADKQIVHARFQSIRPIPENRDRNDWHSQFEKGACAFFDWGPHAIDYTRFITGQDVEKAQAFLQHDADRHRAPTSASFNFQLSGSATLSITFVSSTPHQIEDEPWFVVYFEGGYLAIHGYDRIEVNGDVVYKADDFNPWFELDRIFCEAVRSGNDNALLNDYHDGLYSLAPILAGWESARHNGKTLDVRTFADL